MLSSIAKGYKKLFSTLAVIILLAVCSLALASLVVFPLWKWATSHAASYTIVILSLIALSLIFLLFRSAKKMGFSTFSHKALTFLCLICGIGLFLFFLYRGNRSVALITIPLTLVAYGICAFGFSKK